MEHASHRRSVTPRDAERERERPLLCIELVQRCTDLIDELQRERGLSQLVLGALGESYAAALREQIQLSREAQAALRQPLRQLAPLAGDDAPAWLGHTDSAAHDLAGLGELDRLRQRVLLLQCPRQEMFEAYCSWIEGLLALAGSAGPASGDPALDAELATVLHLMQGKEYSGRERASGTGLFVGGRHDAAAWQALTRLIEAQQHCISRFVCRAGSGARRLLKDTLQPETQIELERLRQQLADTPHLAPLDPALGEIWFRGCSRRMNELREVERQLLQTVQASLLLRPARPSVGAEAPATGRGGRASATTVEAVLRTAATWLNGVRGGAMLHTGGLA